MKKIIGDRADVTVSSDMDSLDVDVIITVGGDGTILRAIQTMEKPVPVLGINMGALGFLTNVDPEGAESVIERMLEGFEVDRRSRLTVMHNNRELPQAMNEVVIVTSMPAKMVHYKIFVDDNELETIRADGVVFATPTGSTAYAMSAGGPIVDPRLNAIIIVPLAPFKLSSRPSIISGESTIRFEPLSSGKDSTLIIDGQHTQPVTGEDSIIIKQSPKPALFVDTGIKFFSRVRNKLVEWRVGNDVHNG